MKNKLYITSILMLLFAVAQAQSDNRSFALSIQATSIEELAREIEKSSNYSVIYNEQVSLHESIIYQNNNRTIQEHLSNILKEQSIGFKIKESHILLFPEVSKSSKPKRRFTISGYVSDTSSFETLIGAHIIDYRYRQGSYTNPYGFYSITLPEGKTDIGFSYLGYHTKTFHFELNNDTVLNVNLITNNQLDEVVITSERQNAGINSPLMGAINLPMTQIKNTPVLLGEADLLKTIQLLPGVQAGMEGFSGLYVRGGGPDQNLIMLDGIPVYNADHLLGVFSVFTTEAVKNVTLYKGSFPARFGGRLSSVVDIRTNDGDMKKYHGTISLGLLTTKLHFEGPIIKDRTSFCITARRTYVDLLAKPFMKGKDIYDYYFYDVNAKINHRFSDKSRLFLGYYQGKDYYSYERKESFDYENYDDPVGAFYANRIKFKWGNKIASARWNYVLSNKLFVNTTIAFNQYSMQMRSSSIQEENKKEDYRRYLFTSDYRSGIKDWSVQTNFDFTPAPTHHIKFGMAYLFHTFRPEVMTSRIKNETNEDPQPEDITLQTVSDGNLYGHETIVYAEDNFDIGDKLSINAGMHASLFHTEGKSYWSVQPRLSAKFNLPYAFSIKTGYNRMAQYVHLLSSTPIALPTDLWVPITKNIKPMYSDQVSAGLYYTGITGWEFSVEGYLKKMKNVLEYQEGATFLGNSAGWEEKVEMGEGRAKGIEFFIQKTSGKTTGWIAYTLAKSDRQFKDGSINQGLVFPYKYDRRHNLNFCINHKFNDRIDIGGTWIITTGGTATIPEQRTMIVTPNGVLEGNYISHRNNYRLPASHCLNLGINFHKKLRRGTQTWNISVYNAYNNMNPNLINSEFIYHERPSENGAEPIGYQEMKLKKYTLLPCIPSVTYTFKF